MKETPKNGRDTAAPRPLELLAPARDCETGRQAILHGADAVYIGADSHGARHAAANSVEDIRRLADFAHRFRAKVYVTVNTLVYEKELDTVTDLCRRLYAAGADALITQDMALLRLPVPPVELHASTQCDTRTVAKARFLEEVGFSQIVLARELTIGEIRDICRSVTVPVECFIHGALCVSYSGRCHASLSCGGRSANRGECAQICRLPYTLTDVTGRVLARDRYLLSLHDLNASYALQELVEAGVSSFKIEGRLKDPGYVKNVTAHYRRLLDDIIARNPEKYRRSSVGESTVDFTPDLSKCFNRGYTEYCLRERKPQDMASQLTPKSLGEPIGDVSRLRPGDGIAWPTPGGFKGTAVNGTAGNKIRTRDGGLMPLPKGARRTFSIEWERNMRRETAVRRIPVSITLHRNRLEAVDPQRRLKVSVDFDPTTSEARRPADRRDLFARLGGTIYSLESFDDRLGPTVFIPNSQLTEARRRLLDALDRAAADTYRYHYRRRENKAAQYPEKALSFQDNVANTMAEAFYRDHGVGEIEPAAEESGASLEGRPVMTTRHCLLRELGFCKRDKGAISVKEPLTLTGPAGTFRPIFDCTRCEMTLLKSGK